MLTKADRGRLKELTPEMAKTWLMANGWAEVVTNDGLSAWSRPDLTDRNNDPIECFPGCLSGWEPGTTGNMEGILNWLGEWRFGDPREILDEMLAGKIEPKKG